MKSRGKDILLTLADQRMVMYSWMSALFEKDEYFTRLIMSIKMPGFEEAIDAAKWVLGKTIAIYQGSFAENDFFLLHGVTSAWSLWQIVGCLKYQDAMEAIFYHLNALMCSYLIQGSPALEPTRWKNNDQTRFCLLLLRGFTRKMNFYLDLLYFFRSLTWDELTQMVLAKEPESVDEHVYKLAQV